MDTNIICDMIRNPDGHAARQIERIEPKKIFHQHHRCIRVALRLRKERIPPLASQGLGHP